MFRPFVAASVALALLLSTRPAAPARAAGSDSIFDPVMNMEAFKVVVPAGWHVEGTLVQGTGCSQIPFPVFRASSKDGLTTVERMPRFDWFWSDNPFAPKDKPGCLNLARTVTADEFLKLLSAMMGVQYLRSVPVAADRLAQAQANVDRNNRPVPGAFGKSVQSVSLAEADVKYRNGSFPMLGHLSGNVLCTTSTFANVRGPSYTSHTCSATVRYVHAPAATYAASQDAMSPKQTGAIVSPEWASAYLQKMSDDAMQRSHDMFLRDQAARQAEHEQFMATMQRGTDDSMRQAAAIANTNHTMASDWTDYALDRQTVRDPGTGQISKVSSTYAHTWIDSTGHTSYQTDSPNANPNGSLPGVWTEQTRTHGDGS